MEIEEGMYTCDRRNPATIADRIAVDAVTEIEEALGSSVGGEWKTCPLLAWSESDYTWHIVAAVSVNTSVKPVSEENRRDFESKVADMIIDQAKRMKEAVR